MTIVSIEIREKQVALKHEESIGGNWVYRTYVNGNVVAYSYNFQKALDQFHNIVDPTTTED